MTSTSNASNGTRYVFVTGGGVSSLGKGLASAALGALLIDAGYSVRCRKFDPYLNVDPGTMSPDEHGECFVTADGAETDLDLGHYERFTGVEATSYDSVSQGMVYRDVIEAERRGDFLGRTVQVFPHIIDRIMACFERGIDTLDPDSKDANPDAPDFVLIEIGGAAGDIESAPFIEAVRQFIQRHVDAGTPERAVLVHLAYMPFIPGAGELKTKPVQHAVKDMRHMGLKPDVLVVRSDRAMPDTHKAKISLFTGVAEKFVVSAPDAQSLYEVPVVYGRNGLASAVLEKTGLNVRRRSAGDPFGMEAVRSAVKASGRKPVRIALVGKYAVRDAYMSVYEAVRHAGFKHECSAEAEFVDAEAQCDLSEFDGIIVPGGFGVRGTAGKMDAIRHARENKVPFLGICFGMQLAVIEYARNVAGIERASSTEFEDFEDGDEPVVCLVEGKNDHDAKGGTMRLGSQRAIVSAGRDIRASYIGSGTYQAAAGGAISISERHRHRWEVNPDYVGKLTDAGLVFAGFDAATGRLAEAVEIPGQCFFAVQFHPEYQSRPGAPHPLFDSLIGQAALKRRA